MQAFVIETAHHAGELARVAGTLAAHGINITGLAAASIGERSTIIVLTNDEAGTRSAFRDAGITAREQEVITASLEDRPGSAAESTRKLAQAGVNIDFCFGTGMHDGHVTVAMGVDQPEKARALLGSSAAASA
jgi:hypothetical protein